MYDFIDRRVTSLDRGGQFLIWSMRSWVLSFAERQCPGARLGPAFAKWGMLAALPRFHVAMTMLNRDGLHTLSFGPLTCHCIQEHEAILLSLFRGLQYERPERIKDMIALLVDEDAIAPLLDAVMWVGLELAKNDMLPAAPVSMTYRPD